MRRSSIPLLAAIPLILAASAQAEDLVEASDPTLPGFGGSVAALSDLTDDGVPEFAVGADSAANGTGFGPGLVTIHDGRTGAEIIRLFPPRSCTRFGATIFRVGDHDGDEVDDLLICDPGELRTGGAPGFGVVVSPATKAVLVTVVGRMSNGQFGTSAASLGDVTGDDVPELLIGEPGPFGTGAGAVGCYDGADGTFLAKFSRESTNDGDNFGTAICAFGDVDGDDIPDWGAGAPNARARSGTALGEIRLMLSRAGDTVLPGKLRTIVNKAGDRIRIGEFLGHQLAAADVDGDGVPELLAAGRGGGAFVQAISIAGKKPKVISRVDAPDGAFAFSDKLVVIPDVDGLAGQEVAIGSLDAVHVFSMRGKRGELVTTIEGEAGDSIGFAFDVLNDVGSLDAQGRKAPADGTPDLLLGASGNRRVLAAALPTRPVRLPNDKIKQAATFGRTPATAAGKATGTVKIKVAKGRASVAFGFKKLPGSGAHELLLETAPGSGEFASVGTFTGSKGKLRLTGDGTLPVEVGGGAFASLGGRIAELRDDDDTPLLRLTLPFPSHTSKTKSTITFLPAPSSPDPGVTATAKLVFDPIAGKSKFKVDVKGAARGQTFELWGETEPGSGDFEKFADIDGGKLRVDEARGTAIEFVTPPGFWTFIGRVLQLRAAGGIVLTRSIGPAVDYAPRRTSLRFLSFFDSFIVRAKVRNLGAVSGGPVNLRARVTFVLDQVVVHRTLEARTTVTIPAGEVVSEIVVGEVDNPFAGQRPLVTVQMVVDPASDGGTGEYLEEDESNNERIDNFSVDPDDPDDYDRD